MPSGSPRPHKAAVRSRHRVCACHPPAGAWGGLLDGSEWPFSDMLISFSGLLCHAPLPPPAPKRAAAAFAPPLLSMGHYILRGCRSQAQGWDPNARTTRGPPDGDRTRAPETTPPVAPAACPAPGHLPPFASPPSGRCPPHAIIPAPAYTQIPRIWMWRAPGSSLRRGGRDMTFNAVLQQALLGRTGRPVIGWSAGGAGRAFGLAAPSVPM
jgi:hypothetical protein